MPKLLWAVHRDLERAYINEGAGDDGMPSLDLWANLDLTPKGFAVSCAYEERIQTVETKWRNEFGDVSITLLRRALEDAAR
jgi:hypothetical protein